MSWNNRRTGLLERSRRLAGSTLQFRTYGMPLAGFSVREVRQLPVCPPWGITYRVEAEGGAHADLSREELEDLLTTGQTKERGVNGLSVEVVEF